MGLSSTFSNYPDPLDPSNAQAGIQSTLDETFMEIWAIYAATNSYECGSLTPYILYLIDLDRSRTRCSAEHGGTSRPFMVYS
jgi:hypothetical protein